MKRSAMFQIIYETIKSQSCLKVDECEEIARDILEEIEKAGMLPPSTKAAHGFLGDEYGMINEWEDE